MARASTKARSVVAWRVRSQGRSDADAQAASTVTPSSSGKASWIIKVGSVACRQSREHGARPSHGAGWGRVSVLTLAFPLPLQHVSPHPCVEIGHEVCRVSLAHRHCAQLAFHLVALQGAHRRAGDLYAFSALHQSVGLLEEDGATFMTRYAVKGNGKHIPRGARGPKRRSRPRRTAHPPVRLGIVSLANLATAAIRPKRPSMLRVIA